MDIYGIEIMNLERPILTMNSKPELPIYSVGFVERVTNFGGNIIALRSPLMKGSYSRSLVLELEEIKAPTVWTEF